MTSLFTPLYSNKMFENLFEDLKTLEQATDCNLSIPYNLYYIVDTVTNLPTEGRLEFALAGISPDDIKVRVIGDKLEVTTLKKEETKKESVERIDVRIGIAKRTLKATFKLDSKVDRKKITKKFENGLLTIVLPFIETDVIEIA